jgi:immune inhibitor A
MLYMEYLKCGKPEGISFRRYLRIVGYVNPARDTPGMDDGSLAKAGPSGLELIAVPSQPVTGQLEVKVLLVDFDDRPGLLPVSHYDGLLFSEGVYPTGSLRDYYLEVSHGKVSVTGSVDGWLRMPKPYSYYTNRESGTRRDSYPRNAQRLAEDAASTALAAGVGFPPSLDKLSQGCVTALFIIHSGRGAEVMPPAQRGGEIWSHKWELRNPVEVGPGLQAAFYLTVPGDCKAGVCAHELGHLAFQWDDFYDPNYDEDGSAWDGSGRWDLMAGGSYNGGGARPAHPAGVHKAQHGWMDVQEIRQSSRVILTPYSTGSGHAARIVSSEFEPRQYLFLENRQRSGFDFDLPGEGLLVWRVDESREQTASSRPALLLIQADGKHQLEVPGDWNEGDAGDPFPGSDNVTTLSDTGSISTSFPGQVRSRIRLQNISRDPSSGAITLDVQFDS